MRTSGKEMIMNRLGGKRVLVLLITLVLGLTQADGLFAEPRMGTGHVPGRVMEALGVVKYVDLAGQMINIDGTVYPMSPDTMWYGMEEDLDLHTQLRRLYNKRVGFAVSYQGQAPMVDAVWVLPDDGAAEGFGNE